MPSNTWSESEKKLARRVFQAALARDLAEVMAEFKSRAAHAQEPDDMWAVRDYLARAQREIDSKYDYRYSQLASVLGVLVREKRIDERELNGLAEDKLDLVRSVATL